MRVVGVDTFGGPEALRVFEVSEPHAGAGEIRIRVHAATVNPTDTFTRNGARAAMLKDFAPPYVSGMDAAGVVDQIGEGSTTDLKVGDRVMAIVIPKGGHGAYSEYIVVPAESAVHIPNDTSFAAASTLPMNGLTARLSLDQLALKPGQTLAVTGAAGAYGGYVVQLAKADGLRVIADASAADHDLVKSLGADVVVLRGDDVAARILEIMPQGVDSIADGSVQTNSSSLPFATVADLSRFEDSRAWNNEGFSFTPPGCGSTRRQQQNSKNYVHLLIPAPSPSA